MVTNMTGTIMNVFLRYDIETEDNSFKMSDIMKFMIEPGNRTILTTSEGKPIDARFIHIWSETEQGEIRDQKYKDKFFPIGDSPYKGPDFQTFYYNLREKEPI